MRAPATLLMLFASVACLLLLPPAAARAEYLTIVEDFEDENGDPAFDPRFSHEFMSILTPPHVGSWGFYDDPVYPTQGTVLGLGGEQDAIQFLLAPSQSVVFASVQVRIWDNPSANAQYSIDFIGTSGQERVYLWKTTGYVTIEMSASEIGPITEIQLRSWEGDFDNITLHVVPEPSAAMLVAFGSLLFLGACFLRSVRAWLSVCQ